MRTFILPVIVSLSLASWGAAQAQEVACAPRDKVLAVMAERYHEAPAAMALSDNGNMVELLTSPDGATWTLLQSTPDGMSCFMASGTVWISARHDSEMTVPSPEQGNGLKVPLDPHAPEM